MLRSFQIEMYGMNQNFEQWVNKSEHDLCGRMNNLNG